MLDHIIRSSEPPTYALTKDAPCVNSSGLVQQSNGDRLTTGRRTSSARLRWFWFLRRVLASPQATGEGKGGYTSSSRPAK